MRKPFRLEQDGYEIRIVDAAGWVACDVAWFDSFKNSWDMYEGAKLLVRWLYKKNALSIARDVAGDPRRYLKLVKKEPKP